ncbi:hypothetical protein B0T10DRAFT_158527 [Thelonectria olida]|uniref:Fungal N-terminal domain-containing protein n=1 Tax=Thelonectria olida TaxID=1576542 RepID=A0A9P8VUB6_9HYPO|nr:hypothetical protein B0T10DRAFT_158527 [Thelonectria olida]
MDPISAIGLVASIVGIVDLGEKVALRAQKVYHAIRDAPAELQKINADIYVLCGIFEQMKHLSEESQTIPGERSSASRAFTWLRQ